MLTSTVGVVAISMLVIAGMDWGPAFVLGVIASPPDAVATIAVVRRLRLLGNRVTILEGESLVNDATALVLYRVAVAAVVTGGFSLLDAIGQFFLVATFGIVIGLALGWLVYWFLLHVVQNSSISVAVSLLTPVSAYLLAEELGSSGPGLRGGWLRHRAEDAAVGAVPDAVPDDQLLANRRHDGPDPHRLGLPGGRRTPDLPDRRCPGLDSDTESLTSIQSDRGAGPGAPAAQRDPTGAATAPPWGRGDLVVRAAGASSAWRPRWRFPTRRTAASRSRNGISIIFLAFCVILATLVGQGRTLPFLIRRLKFPDDPHEDREFRDALSRVLETGLLRLEDVRRKGETEPAVADQLKALLERRPESVQQIGSHQNGSSLDENRAVDRLAHEIEETDRTAIRELASSGEISETIRRRRGQRLDLQRIGREVP